MKKIIVLTEVIVEKILYQQLLFQGIVMKAINQIKFINLIIVLKLIITDF
jgi:hypothetical protein